MLESEFDPRVAEALPTLSSLAADEDTRQRVHKILGAPGTRLVTSHGSEYLFALQPSVRDEYPQYQFFVFGRLLEIRRIGDFSNQYSMADFPADLVVFRSRIEARFAEISLSTEEGMGLFAPARWEDLSEEQKAIAKPMFVQDNLRFFSM